MIRVVVRAALILGLAGLAVYAFNRGEGGEPGGSLYRRLIDRIFGDGSQGLFDRLYVCIPREMKPVWDNPDGPGLDAETKDWLRAQKVRVDRLARMLTLPNAAYHLQNPGAAFGIVVEPMPGDPVLRRGKKEALLMLGNTRVDYINRKQMNPCDHPSYVTQEIKLTFRRVERK